MHHQQDDNILPRRLVECTSTGLDDVLPPELVAQTGEAREDLDLIHEPLELGSTVQLHIHSGKLNGVPQVLYVRVEVRERGRRGLALLQHARPLDVIVEGPELLLHGLAVRLRRECALHEVVEALCEADSGLPRGVQNVVLADRLALLLDEHAAALVVLLHGLEPRQHRRQRIREELLSLHLHVEPEVVDANGLNILLRHALPCQSPRIPFCTVGSHLAEGLGRLRAIPMWQRDGISHEVVWQVAEALNPLVDVVSREIVVILVELVSDEDGAPVGGVHLLALPQGGEACSIARLLHAQHDVVLILHELVDKLLDLHAKLLHHRVLGVGAEPGQVDQPQVHRVRTLDLDADGHLADVGAELLVGLADKLHHLLDGVRVPDLSLVVVHRPPRRYKARHVPQLEDGRTPGTQSARDEIERLPGQTLNQARLADTLLADHDELRDGEGQGINLPVQARLDLTDEIQKQFFPLVC
mmetsp:Transcript_18824/g.48876  ORF Transcript_18824/g.48876 Transcript_18824/m.48876 type:complete len:471 (-) Transcript_18824:82-1494(-)